jgi:hypothetical protein
VIEAYIIFLLAGLNVFQHVFWARQTQKLMDKLMCRNYFEYKQANQAFKPEKPRHVEPDPEEDLNELSGVGGF